MPICSIFTGAKRLLTQNVTYLQEQNEQVVASPFLSSLDLTRLQSDFLSPSCTEAGDMSPNKLRASSGNAPEFEPAYLLDDMRHAADTNNPGDFMLGLDVDPDGQEARQFAPRAPPPGAGTMSRTANLVASFGCTRPDPMHVPKGSTARWVRPKKPLAADRQRDRSISCTGGC
jgi:hypothetical protein